MIADFLRREIDRGSFPSASWAVGSFAGIEEEGAVGNAVAVPLRIPATPDTIYDCASLTKALITTPLALQLLELNDAVWHLLTHTSGLRAWLPLYAYGDYLQAIREHGRECDPDTRVIYSDLNFVLLWSMLSDYERHAASLIFGPLGIGDEAMFHPPRSLRPRIAATEWGQHYEAAMCKVPFTGFREGLIWGETHDGNSHHAGGTAGNAGLFATARAVFRIAQAFARGELVPPAMVEEATRNQTAKLDLPRGLGWDKPSAGSLATSMLSPNAYGHTGFTGTSVWIDPDRDRILVLLTNRVHPSAGFNVMQAVRGEFHRLALG